LIEIMAGACKVKSDCRVRGLLSEQQQRP